MADREDDFAEIEQLLADEILPRLRAILAGRLLPAGGERRVQWGVLYQDGSRHKTFDAAAARGFAAVNGAALQCRDFTVWPDGSAFSTAWRPVESGVRSGQAPCEYDPDHHCYHWPDGECCYCYAAPDAPVTCAARTYGEENPTDD